METVYISENNCVLHRCEDHFILKKQGHRIATIPLINVKTIILLSNTQITTPAIDKIFEKNIDVIYTSKTGKIKGRLQSQISGGAIVRLAQYNTFVSAQDRLSIAKSMVLAKVSNQKKLIEKYRRHNSNGILNLSITKMDKYSQKIEFSSNIDEVMGIEGISARVYWECYKKLLDVKVFTRRDYRPAPDYVNSSLNLGYAFLANEITICLAALKFDIEIGFLHSVHYGRSSLALDIMEEFRSAFIDDWLLALFNKKRLKEEYFYGNEKNFYLKEEGFKKFIDLYHEHVESGDWKNKFKSQAYNLKKAVMEGVPYDPFYRE